MSQSPVNNQATLWSPEIAAEFTPSAEAVLSHGDCLPTLRKLPGEFFKLIITSPPYNLGKEYEEKLPFDEYLTRMEPIIDECARVLAPNGSLCWQVGNYVADGEIFPLDIFFYRMLKRRGLKLRNRIVWHFEHGQHTRHRFSGRYEMLLWFTKSDEYTFNLDEVRVPSKYPDKKYFRGPKHGQLSGHPLGKNPGDTWKISGSGELIAFPVEAQRIRTDAETFTGLANFVEMITRKLVRASEVDSPSVSVGSTSEAEIRDPFLRAVPHQANLIFLGGHLYTTITIERSPQQISLEFGRNRWIFTSPKLAQQFSERNRIERYSFAVNLQSENSPITVLLNLVPGFQLPGELIYQLAGYRRITYGEAGVTPSLYPSVSDFQLGEISRFRKETARVFLLESFLSLALHHSRVTVSRKRMTLPPLQSGEETGMIVPLMDQPQGLPSIVMLVREITTEEGVNTWQIIKRDWESAFWEIPNVKASHAEKTIHPCQFPIELVERCVIALTNENDWVLDPFAGVGSSVVAALRRRRRAMGCEKEERFVSVARQRVIDYYAGNLGYRPLGRPVPHPQTPARRRPVPMELLEA